MFIVIDGIDGAGKSTQIKLMKEALENLGKTVKIISYPQYSNKSCYFVEKYLNGDYGLKVSAKQASLFYALDRFDSKKKLTKDLNTYDYVLSDRYVSANMIHQGGKIISSKKRKEFIKWIYNLEYKILDLPKPNLTIFLNISIKQSQKLINKRDNKDYIKSSFQKDIHEEDLNHLKNAKRVIKQVLKVQKNFLKINCEKKGVLFSKEEILSKIIFKI